MPMWQTTCKLDGGPQTQDARSTPMDVATAYAPHRRDSSTGAQSIITGPRPAHRNVSPSAPGTPCTARRIHAIPDPPLAQGQLAPT